MSEWVFVKPKKQKHNPGAANKVKSQPKKSRGISQAKIDRAVYLSGMADKDDLVDEMDLVTLLEQVATAREAVRTTSFYAGCVAALHAALATKGGLPFSSAVLLGLGQFSRGRCTASLLQLALILELLAEQSLFGGGVLPGGASVFDPVMTTRDADLCSALGLTIASQSQQPLAGSAPHLQPVREDGRTLFYMPHCPYLLYNHIIWTNWHSPQLSSLVMLGNSFESYNMRHIEHSSAPSWDCVRRLAELVEEQSVWHQASSRQLKSRQQASGSSYACLSALEHAFNDMSVVCFHEAALSSEAGRRLLHPDNRASALEVAAAVRADLEMIDTPATSNSHSNSSKAEDSGAHRADKTLL